MIAAAGPVELRDLVQSDFELGEQPTLTYKLDLERGRIAGRCEGLEAMRQAVYLILHTERYRYDVYSWAYGVSLEDLFGRHMPYVLSELKVRIEAALLRDSRVLVVRDFAVKPGRNEVLVSFTAETTEGNLDFEEVKVRV